MKISYCFPESPRLASWRYRIDIPGQYLKSQGHECWEGSDGEIVYFAKHFDPDDLEIAEQCTHKGQKVVFDCCDNHLNGPYAIHYRRMIDLAHLVTCPTQAIQEAIKAETGIDARVVSDPYEYPESSPKKPGTKLFWFGHQSNLHTLKGLDLNGYSLAVLSGNDWSHENMLMGFRDCDIVIIPTNPEKQYKSPNRMVESIRQGLYVVAGPMPAYEGYGMWVGDLKQGLAWAIEHPEQVHDALLDAQEIVREKHSPEVIGRQWETLLNSL